MSTFMAKAHEVDRKWYIIDAAGKPLGRVAAQAAAILRGKHKPEFTPHCDCGDHMMFKASVKVEHKKDDQRQRQIHKKKHPTARTVFFKLLAHFFSVKFGS